MQADPIKEHDILSIFNTFYWVSKEDLEADVKPIFIDFFFWLNTIVESLKVAYLSKNIGKIKQSWSRVQCKALKFIVIANGFLYICHFGRLNLSFWTVV